MGAAIECGASRCSTTANLPPQSSRVDEEPVSTAVYRSQYLTLASPNDPLAHPGIVCLVRHGRQFCRRRDIARSRWRLADHGAGFLLSCKQPGSAHRYATVGRPTAKGAGESLRVSATEPATDGIRH